MELYIRIKDGLPFEHPILEDNFKQAFIGIDTDNLPPEFARFVRVPPPVIDLFEVYEGCTYELVDGVYTDVHHVRPMTAEEKTTKIEEARARLPENWTLNEENLQPIKPPRPTVKGEYPYRFDRETNQWVESSIPPFPSWIPSEDGLGYVAPTPRPEGQYYWDEDTLSWIAINV